MRGTKTSEVPFDPSGSNEKAKTPVLMREAKDNAPGEEANSPVGLVILFGLIALLAFGAGFRYLVMAFGLLAMIFFHELGHFMTARWTGMKVTQFFIGIGPRIWSFRRGEVEYGVRAIPAAAFVRIIGMNNLDPVEDPADEPRAYYNATYPRRMLVITAGSMMHFAQAMLLFIFLVTTIGAPSNTLDNGWEVAEIAKMETGETPSEVAGIQIGDQIVSVDGIEVVNFTDFRDYVASNPERVISLGVERDGDVFETTTTLASLPQDDGSVIGFLGVAPKPLPVKGSVLDGAALFGSAMKSTVVDGLPRLFSPSTFINLGEQVIGGTGAVDFESEEAQRPVSVVGVVRVAGNPDFDWAIPIFFLAIVNIFVGVFNLLPLLPLDGGHAAIATYERIRSKRDRPYRADVAKLLPLAYTVMGLLAFMFVSTLWLDIFNPIQ